MLTPRLQRPATSLQPSRRAVTAAIKTLQHDSERLLIARARIALCLRFTGLGSTAAQHCSRHDSAPRPANSRAGPRHAHVRERPAERGPRRRALHATEERAQQLVLGQRRAASRTNVEARARRAAASPTIVHGRRRRARRAHLREAKGRGGRFGNFTSARRFCQETNIRNGRPRLLLGRGALL